MVYCVEYYENVDGIMYAESVRYSTFDIAVKAFIESKHRCTFVRWNNNGPEVLAYR